MDRRPQASDSTPLSLRSIPAATMTILLWILTTFVRWVRLKIYQYEVTFAIYMLTPTEKFIFSMWTPVLPRNSAPRNSFPCCSIKGSID